MSGARLPLGGSWRTGLTLPVAMSLSIIGDFAESSDCRVSDKFAAKVYAFAWTWNFANVTRTPSMRRFLHHPRWISLAGGLLLCASVASWAFAEESGGGNPLRPVARPSGKGEKGPAAATTVGTAVRTVAKRTPSAPAEIQPPATVVSRSRAVAASRPNEAAARPVVPAAYRRRVGRPGMGFTPAHENYPDGALFHGTVTTSIQGEVEGQLAPEKLPPGAKVVPGSRTVVDGGVIYEDGGVIGDEFGEFGGDCGDGCGMDGNCGPWGCFQCCLIPCPRIPWDDLTVFGGAQGFTGPKNIGDSGSFGFHEGVNWGAPLPLFNGCFGMQAGARFTQSNLSGTDFSPDTRHQVFLTGGVFRRVDWGLQGGIAFDYLSDEWYTNTRLSQLRGELSWVFPCGHELGAWVTSGLSEDTAATRIFVNQIPQNGTATWEPTDLYAFFYRHRFSGWEGATCRLYGGFTGDSDGLVGADAQVPLSCDLALQAGFTFLAPQEAKAPAGVGDIQESWNVGISLVWYPGCNSATTKSYFAPLFQVADNGSFMVDQLR